MKSGRRLLAQFANELEANRGISLVLFTVFYLLTVSLRAFRPFWYDELITYNITTLPSLAAVWHAITHGYDLNPPLFHTINWLGARLLGRGEFALRVPSILGFLILCWSLNGYVTRRAGACFGFAAMLVPMVTGAFQYAAEARAYGMMLGFCGLALICWLRAAEAGDGTRRAWLAGLAASLSAALLTHTYAVLLLVPFGMAQIAGDIRRRGIDWAMWMTLTLPLGVCVTYLPLLGSLQPYAMDNPVFRPSWHSLIDFYDFLVTPALWPLMAGGIIVAVASAKSPKPLRENGNSWKIEDTALAIGFLLVPLLAVVIADLATRIFMFRYGLAAVIAVSILFTQLASYSTQRSREIGAALTLLLLGWSSGVSLYRIAMAVTAAPQANLALNAKPTLPLVISSGTIYYELNHYGGPEITSHMWYLTDPQTARRATGSDVFERGFPDLNRWFPLRANLAGYHVFLATHPNFLVYGYEAHDLDWLIPQLQRDGATLTFLGHHQEQFGRAVLYEVHLPTAAMAKKAE